MEDMINFITPHPLGVIPQRFWEEKTATVPLTLRDEQRAAMLLEAVFRYCAAGLDPSPEWSAEWEELLVNGVHADQFIDDLFEHDRRMQEH